MITSSPFRNVPEKKHLLILFGCRLLIAIALLSLFPRHLLAEAATAYQEFESKCLAGSVSSMDSLVVKGQIFECDAFLSLRFERKMLDDFYSSLEQPNEYYPSLQKTLGWNFRKSYKHLYKHMLKRAGESNADGGWQTLTTPHFEIYYRANRYDTAMLPVVGEFLEKSLSEIKAQLLVKTFSEDLARLQIKSFYPDAPAPEAIELTGGRIQVILVSGQEEFQQYFPREKPEYHVGGACAFSFLHDRARESRAALSSSLEIVNIFAGYASFPLIAHELAHAVRYLYHTDFDGLRGNIAQLDTTPGFDDAEYGKRFAKLAREATPGSNRIVEEAIAVRAMLGTGPISRIDMIPSCASILYARPDKNFKFISLSAAGRADVGLANKVAYVFGMKQGAEKKAGDFIFAWADFLGYLDKRFPDDKMIALYNIKGADISDPFSDIFGATTETLESEWVAAICRPKDNGLLRQANK